MAVEPRAPPRRVPGSLAAASEVAASTTASKKKRSKKANGEAAEETTTASAAPKQDKADTGKGAEKDVTANAAAQKMTRENSETAEQQGAPGAGGLAGSGTALVAKRLKVINKKLVSHWQPKMARPIAVKLTTKLLPSNVSLSTRPNLPTRSILTRSASSSQSPS